MSQIRKSHSYVRIGKSNSIVSLVHDGLRPNNNFPWSNYVLFAQRWRNKTCFESQNHVYTKKIYLFKHLPITWGVRTVCQWTCDPQTIVAVDNMGYNVNIKRLFSLVLQCSSPLVWFQKIFSPFTKIKYEKQNYLQFLFSIVFKKRMWHMKSNDSLCLSSITNILLEFLVPNYNKKNAGRGNQEGLKNWTSILSSIYFHNGTLTQNK